MNALAWLDPKTLLAVNVCNVAMLAITLLVVIGRDAGMGARSARNMLVAQALGWLALLVANVWPDRLLFNNLFAALAVAGFSLSNWWLFVALEAWLGERPGRFALLALCVLTPVGYAIVFSAYSLRVPWANTLFAGQFALLALGALLPSARPAGRWRWALALCAGGMALLSCGRAVLGGFFAGSYPHFMAPHPFNVAYLLLTDLALIVINASLLVAWRGEADQQLRAQLITDPLTAVLNRRGWDEAAARAFAQARRHRQPLALLMIDLDHFKRINDSRGHQAGDAALRFLGKILHRQQRAGDIVARVGGEEFYVLMPMTDATAARVFDRRLRDVLATWAAARLGHDLAFSAGLACLEDTDESISALAERADRALYRAKAAGRGRLISA